MRDNNTYERNRERLKEQAKGDYENNKKSLQEQA